MNRAAAFFRKVLLMLGFYLSLIDEPDDKEKFAEIFRSYGNMMFSKAMSVLHNTALAEEAVQESFLKIAKNISKISEPNCSKTAAFIVIIVRNTAIDMLKNEHINDTAELDGDIPDISDSGGGAGISEEQLMTFVAELPDGCRTVFNLYVFEEKSHKEIAKMLHIKEHSSTSQLHRAKYLLAKRIKEYRNHEERK